MNQILYVEKNKGRKSNKPLDIKKVVLIFSIFLIIFGISLCSVGAYSIVRNNNYKKAIENAVPQISVELDADGYYIVVSHIREIASLTYNWNGTGDIKIDTANRMNIKEKIEPPIGNNLCSIYATDVNGKENKLSKQITVDKDIQKPKINIAVDGNYLAIVATDDYELSYITYRWNDEAEEIVHPNGSDSAKIETKVEIRKGQNTFTVSAVDSNNNTSTRSQTINGVTKPTVEVYVDGDSFVITAKHEIAVERIEYTLNGKKYSIQIEPGPIMQYRQKMDIGENNLSVQAYSTNGILGTYEGNYTYTPAPEG